MCRFINGVPTHVGSFIRDMHVSLARLYIIEGTQDIGL